MQIIPYLHSKSYETRNAASVALSQIFSLTPLWQPAQDADAIIACVPEVALPPPEYPNFSVQELVLQGKLLLASSGKEFIRPAGILSSSAEVKKARKEAMGRLGLEFLDNLADEIDLDKELIADEDGDVEMEAAGVKSEDRRPSLSPMDACPPSAKDSLKLEVASESPTRSVTPAEPSPTTPSSPDADLSALSARERNRLKRKRKPGNTAVVNPPPQSSGSKYSAAAAGPHK